MENRVFLDGARGFFYIEIMTLSHIDWMAEAVAFARTAMDRNEVPIAAILVSKGREIAREFTRVSTTESSAAHAETLMLLEAKIKPFTDYQPLVLYCTLEPCVMCLGAAMNCEVDTIVYGLPAKPDGGTVTEAVLRQAGRPVPQIIGGVLQTECDDLMHEFLQRFPDHPGGVYVRSLYADKDD
jgi:tRNA(adenine34) deaminase